MTNEEMRDDLAQKTFAMAIAHLMHEFPRQTEFEINNTLKFIAALSHRAADAMMAERAK
jgi:hypothetical protein